jgi:hypothetical protein
MQHETPGVLFYIPTGITQQYRQLLLWEAPQSIEARNSTTLKEINVAQPARRKEEDVNMESTEQTLQVQWLH